MSLRQPLLVLMGPLWLAALASPARAEEPAYAIVVGQNEPPREAAGGDLPPLRYADDDALRFAQHFERFAETRLLAVLDAPTQRRYPGRAGRAERPTLGNLRRAVSDIAESMAADRARGDKPVFYFAFSGHGARSESGEVFLALTEGALTEDVLYDEVLGELPSASSHVLIDACHAAGVVGARGFFDVQIDGRTAPVRAAEASEVVSRRIDEFPHVGYMVATTPGQQAHEWSEIEAGVFSHALLSALAGAADVNGDLQIEYSEAQAFVASATRDMPDPRARPDVIARPPRTNRSAPLVSLGELSEVQLLSGGFGKLGHFFIELENGQRYLDAHMARGEGGTIALPAGRRAFLRTSAREAAIPASGAAALAELSFRERSVAARGSLDASYRAGLFASAYGSDYYRGFVDSIGAVGVRFAEDRGDKEPRGGERRRKKRYALGAASVAGVSAIASTVGAVFALRAKRDFESTELQRPAHEARQRYRRSMAVTAAAGASAAVAGALAWWLWPRGEPAIAPRASPEGDVGLSLRLSW